jgi:hypothetical protein
MVKKKKLNKGIAKFVKILDVLIIILAITFIILSAIEMNSSACVGWIAALLFKLEAMGIIKI